MCATFKEKVVYLLMYQSMIMIVIINLYQKKVVVIVV